MVCRCRIPRVSQRTAQTAEVNWGPLSEEMAAGTPKRAIQLVTRLSAMEEADVSANGIASSHLVDLSTIVSRWVWPSADTGRGPTKSTWMWLKH